VKSRKMIRDADRGVHAGWFILGPVFMMSCPALQASSRQILLVNGEGKLKGATTSSPATS